MTAVLDDHEYPTELARDILVRLFPEWRSLFLKKNSGYKETHGLLGVKGCFPDIWRKVYRLKDALWDDADTNGWSEQPREILLDLIGHAFMVISLMDAAVVSRGLCVHCEQPIPSSDGQVINHLVVHDACALAFLTKELEA